MNNVLVNTENKKKHNKIVRKVLKKIKVNNLYIKSEKQQILE